MLQAIDDFVNKHKGVRRLVVFGAVILVGYCNYLFAINFGNNTMGDATGLGTINLYASAVAKFYFDYRNDSNASNT